MANKWVSFVKEWASKHGTNYSKAVANAECKAEYHQSNPKVAKKRGRPASKKEEEIMIVPKTKKVKVSKVKVAKVAKVAKVQKKIGGVVGEETLKEALIRQATTATPTLIAPEVASSPVVAVKAKRKYTKKIKDVPAIGAGLPLSEIKSYYVTPQGGQLSDDEGETDTEDNSDDEEDNPLAHPHFWDGHQWIPIPHHPPAGLEDDEILEGEGRRGGGIYYDKNGCEVYTGGCSPCLEDYDMIIKHLVSHITDPNEPVDPRDYNQTIHFIKRVKAMKGGVLALMKQSETGYPLFGGMDTPRPNHSDSDFRSIKDLTPLWNERRMKTLRVRNIEKDIADGMFANDDALLRQRMREKRELIKDLGYAPVDFDAVAYRNARGEMVYGRPPAGKGWESKPTPSGNQWLDVIANTGHDLGKAHPFGKVVNPFDAGMKFGEKVVAPALMKTKLGNPKTGIFSKKFWTIKKKHH
jgi:hypothetical protein